MKEGSFYLDIVVSKWPSDIKSLFEERLAENAPLVMRLVLDMDEDEAAFAADLLTSHFKERVAKAISFCEYSSYMAFAGTSSPFEKNRMTMRRCFTKSQQATPVKKKFNDLPAQTDPSPCIPLNLEAKPRILFSYPPNSQDSVTINTNDVLRLGDGYYLNDSLIQFELRRMLDDAQAIVQNQVHIFSSFFFHKLKSTESPCSLASHVNIFEKRFLLFPINESLHWYLALVYQPDAIAFGDVHSSVAPSFEGSSNSEDAALPEQIPYVIILDSLGSRHRRTAVELIKSWIIFEAQRNFQVEKSKKDFITLYPRLPLQLNFVDCGCFLLEYTERFLADPEMAIQSILAKADMSKWFGQETASDRRCSIKRRIEQFEMEYKSISQHFKVETIATPSASSDIEEIYPD